MRNLLISFVALVLISSLSFAQNRRGDIGRFDRYTPITLSAGTAMSGRTDAASLDDTTQTVDIRGFSQVNFTLVTATNDSASALVSYRGSVDGSTWSAFAVIDSLSTSGTVGVEKGFALPSAGYSFDYIQFRVYGSVSALHSANPSSTITSHVVKRY